MLRLPRKAYVHSVPSQLIRFSINQRLSNMQTAHHKRICFDNFTCCHTERKYADQTRYLSIFVSLLINVSATCRVRLTNGFALAILRVATLSEKLLIKLAVSVYSLLD